MKLTEEQIERSRFWARVMLDWHGDARLPDFQRWAAMTWLKQTRRPGSKPTEKALYNFKQIYKEHLDWRCIHDVKEGDSAVIE